MHASLVLAHDVMDYAPLFAEIADAFFERNMFADARPIYETLGMDAGVCTSDTLRLFKSTILKSVYRQAACIFFFKPPRAVVLWVTSAKLQRYTSMVRTTFTS